MYYTHTHVSVSLSLCACGHSPHLLEGHGHVIERNRDLVVSGGLGCSIAPIRFGVPPEIVLMEVGSGAFG